MSDAPLEVSCQSVHQRLGTAGFLLLDCREPSEYATASISGAMLLPMSEINERVGEIAASHPTDLVIHCHHGGRSLRMARWLRQNGFPQAASMAGGIEQWSLEIDQTVPRY